MKKINMIRNSSIALSGIGIILFWVFGAKGIVNLATYSFFAAGAFAFIGLAAAAIGALRKRNLY